MAIKVGINGMGRIGRMVIRAIIEGKNKEIIQWKRKVDKRDHKGFYLGNAGIAILKSLVIFELSKNKEKSYEPNRTKIPRYPKLAPRHRIQIQ